MTCADGIDSRSRACEISPSSCGDLNRASAAAAEHSATAAKLLDATFAAVSADVLVSITNLHSPLYATAGYPAVTVPLGLRASGSHDVLFDDVVFPLDHGQQIGDVLGDLQ